MHHFDLKAKERKIARNRLLLARQKSIRARRILIKILYNNEFPVKSEACKITAKKANV